MIGSHSPARLPLLPAARGAGFQRGELVLGLYGGFPVSPGHVLLVTARHVAGSFEAAPGDQAALTQDIGETRPGKAPGHWLDAELGDANWFNGPSCG